MPAPSRALDEGQCATPGTGGAEPGDLRRRQVHGVGQPHVAAEPPQFVEVLHRRAAVAFAAVLLLVEGLGQVGVEPETQAPGEDGRFGKEFARDGER